MKAWLQPRSTHVIAVASAKRRYLEGRWRRPHLDPAGPEELTIDQRLTPLAEAVERLQGLLPPES